MKRVYDAQAAQKKLDKIKAKENVLKQGKKMVE